MMSVSERSQLRKSIISLILVSLLVGTLAAPAMAQNDRATGQERARIAAMQALDRAQGRMAEVRGQGLPLGKPGKASGLARAAEAVAAGLARANGNGNTFGRGQSAGVLAALMAGESLAELDGKHGRAVSEMVRAYNELKRQQREAG